MCLDTRLIAQRAELSAPTPSPDELPGLTPDFLCIGVMYRPHGKDRGVRSTILNDEASYRKAYENFCRPDQDDNLQDGFLHVYILPVGDGSIFSRLCRAGFVTVDEYLPLYRSAESKQRRLREEAEKVDRERIVKMSRPVVTPT